MINDTVIEKLQSIYKAMKKVSLPKKGDGWVRQYDFQSEVIKARINFKNMGYERFHEFLLETGKFQIWTDYTGEKPIRYVIDKGISLYVEQYTQQRIMKPSVKTEDVEKLKLRLRLTNNEFIGQFIPSQNEGWYKIVDIRNTDFTKIEDKERGIKDLSINFKCTNKDFSKYAYYKFTWVLLGTDPLKFGIDLNRDIDTVSPKDIIKCLHDSIINYSASASKKITRMLDTLNKQLTQSGKEVFIYELLQNANDYPRKDIDRNTIIPVDVEFYVTDEYLIFEHSGEYFNAKNIAAICGINDGEKSDNIEAIGYKGIGFKTVFLDNDYVYLHTGTYSFRFDKSATDIINTPWQILPIWTDLRHIDDNIQKIFNRTDDKEFRVKFALRPREPKILTDSSLSNNYISLFKRVFDTERVILFIPNIRTVRVYFGNNIEPIIVRSKDNTQWCVSRAMEDDVPSMVTDRINEIIQNPNADKTGGYDKVPEKYQNFRRTSVKFACRIEGRELLPVENAHLYCYLPAKKADWGFKFLMNTDMVPNGERDDIEDIELNHEIAKIAGRQFYYWIKELIACGEYELDSIFNLIPDFYDCINRKAGYCTFIEEFRDEFEGLIKREPFVPCINKDGDEVDATIDDIINDETGMSAKGFMADTEFIELSNTGCNHLPIKGLRTSKAFHTFLYRYSPASNDFTFDSLKTVVSSAEFMEWLENEENDTNFILHLLDEDQLTEFSDKEIFIEAGGSLFRSKNVYIDFDSEMSRIGFLRDYIPYLSPSLRTSLSRHEKWSDYEDSYFKEFDAEDMLKEFILNDSDALATLGEETNSVAFFKFASEKDIDMSIIEDISFFDEYGNMQTEYGKTYFYSEDVCSLNKEEWLPEDSLYILSHAYFDEPSINDALCEKFKELGVRQFVHGEFIHEKLIDDFNFVSDVNELITDDFGKNLTFVLYVFAHKDALKEKDNQLKKYVLLCKNKDGEELYLNKDEVRYFAHYTEPGNSSYNDNISFGWITNTMMYALHQGYIESVAPDQQKAFESFLRQSFGVQTFTDKSFWTDVISKNNDIYDHIETNKDALSFLSYIVRDRRILLDGSISFCELKKIPLLRADGSVSSNRNYTLYAYDEVAEDMESRSWYTQEFYLLDKAYSEQLNTKELQLLQIEAFDFQTALNTLCEDHCFRPYNAEDNIGFWRWIKAHTKDITDYTKVQLVSVYVDGCYSWKFNELYIPDAFFPAGEGIESIVKQFDEGATFVPVSLLEDQTEKCKADWLRLLKKLGAKSDNKAILDHVLENLGDYEDDSILSLLTLHKKELIDNWSDKLSYLQKLKVRTRCGEYMPLNECIIVKKVDGDAEAEPFKDIVLNNEVAPELFTANSEIIIRIAESFQKNNVLVGRREWASYKIDEYINRIQDDDAERAHLHTQFIKDLAKWGDSFELDKEQVSQIQFRSKGSGRFLDAKDLTLGSQYKPACNFEKYHVNLDYLSDSYLTDDNKDLICTFFKENTDIHHRFEKEDIEYMSNREFAIYIWTVIFKRVTSIGKWIQEGKFNGIKCIPTAQSVKCPEDLYSPHLLEYVRLCDNYTDKIPAIDISKLEDGKVAFMKLPFKTSLESEDCLAFLLKAQEKNDDDKKHRKQIIDWLLENDDLRSQDIEAYRANPEAKWKNGRGQYAHISSLYAIHPAATQEHSVFNGDENIIRTWCFPNDEEQFESICDMLGIRVLKSEDFKTIPVAPVSQETREILEKIKVRLLILAAIDHDDKYAKYYEKYLEEVTKYGYYSCAQIELAYGDIHGSVGRTYIDDTDSKVYYVKAWDNQRTYTKFCHTIKVIAGVRANDDICEEVFDESMPLDALIDKYCYSLRSDRVFLKYMEDLKQHVLAVEEYIKESVVEEMKYEAYEGEEESSEVPQKEVSPVVEVESKRPENESILEEEIIEVESAKEVPEEEPIVDSEPTRGNVPPKSKEPRNSNWKREPHNYSKEDLENMRSYGSPLELTTLPPTVEEVEILTKCGISPEKIADSNYVAQLRLYRNLQNDGQQPEESMEEFIQNSGDVTEHRLCGGKYIHTCSAARGVMYVSPSIWNKVMDGQCAVCIYYGPHANQFFYVHTSEDLLKLVEKDDVVIKITGKEKVNVVGALYNGLLKNVKGTAYTLIRVAAHTEMDAVFAHYVGAMAEKNDGNEDEDEY